MFKVDLVSRHDYLNFIAKHPYRNFYQYPSWADLKTEWKWTYDYIGWFSSSDVLVGCALILYRKVPGINKHLAYIPRGPLIDWFGQIPIHQWFDPLFQYLKTKQVFSLKMDPPLTRQKWSSKNIASGRQEFQSYGLSNKRITDISSDVIYNGVEYIGQELDKMGWRKWMTQESFDTVQPTFVYRLNMKGKSLNQLFVDFDPLVQDQIRKADDEGIQISEGDESELVHFHDLLRSTAKREQSEVRTLQYFNTMFQSLKMEDVSRIRLYFAKKQDQYLSAALTVRVDGHFWELYSACTSYEAHEPGSYLMRWKMIQDAYALGDRTYDFQGVHNQIDEEHAADPILQYKLGFGGEVHELMGEWDFPVMPMLHWAFDMYMKKGKK
ncbi:peptidoglycan bridge formation glycyltransferase FemA/FemB family protein [Hazenella sp. IB182357]|uniref:Lipid II:glycine glycyltransferase n=1 Tax=Polycladospora coralii TaxID=2771432 RepID=A0A926N8U3_9BACL|nr:peptidoglycan bridge formation glycyltransferase FemA/FemB family protein [Polycladospora coralii]MBD1371813.1 peptidoglycan bridge formation glycyltransferase FemA/FemB family protein [Polycladospora coralii]MBS7529274.1 peptidoglycan bridge formation glycyltransferase FemA/FemB family protein [Polycladospora coralii]